MNDTPGIGHNQPFARADELVRNANRWLRERAEISNEEEAGMCQLAISQLRTEKADLEAKSKAERKPHDEAIAEIKRIYSEPLDLIGIALPRLLAIAEKWLQRKREAADLEAGRKLREADEARRRASEAAAAADAEKTVEAELAAQRAREEAERLARESRRAPPPARIKGDYAARAMGLRETWTAEVTDAALALRSYRGNPEVRAAALDKALQLARATARREKRADAAPAGFRFFSTSAPT